MPTMIHPRVSGTVSIEMSMSEVRTLINALDAVLERPSTTWVDKTLRQEVNGETCNVFLRALKKEVD